MHSKTGHHFFSSMSNPELFLIKNDREDLSNFEIAKRPTLKFHSESAESLSISSNSHNSQDKEEENSNNQEIIVEEECHNQRRILVPKHKQADSESRATPSSSSEEEKLKVEDEEDGFRTPTSLDHRISVATECPPAPRKPKPSLTRKAPYNDCNCRHPSLDLSKEVELLFPTQHIPLSDSHQSTKKIRREEPK